eukprot:TRINITY_DN61873_c0_g1_i1.p1 TRINITY_DN61873_c0_g1~~TRINITY_DN61873_c0_g1_i1.p1  ORF type:complete len:1157 (+),score=142.73 TRINITY_DN61873_c0_g1_i1:158-3472(+)
MNARERETCRNEVRVLRRLSHPCIVTYVDHFESRQILFIVTEFADSGDLGTLIKQHQQQKSPLNEEQVLRYFAQVLLAVKHVHDKKILHRDLKPANVFLTNQGRLVKLGDFGISTVLRNSVAVARTQCGTPLYFSPELCQHQPYNSKTDVWSLGCLLYELCALKPAFEAQNLPVLVNQICSGTCKPLPAHYSPDLRNLVSALLIREPTMRPSVKEIMQVDFLQAHLWKVYNELNLPVPPVDPSVPTYSSHDLMTLKQKQPPKPASPPSNANRPQTKHTTDKHQTPSVRAPTQGIVPKEHNGNGNGGVDKKDCATRSPSPPPSEPSLRARPPSANAARPKPTSTSPPPPSQPQPTKKPQPTKVVRGARPSPTCAKPFGGGHWAITPKADLVSRNAHAHAHPHARIPSTNVHAYERRPTQPTKPTKPLRPGTAAVRTPTPPAFLSEVTKEKLRRASLISEASAARIASQIQVNDETQSNLDAMEVNSVASKSPVSPQSCPPPKRHSPPPQVAPVMGAAARSRSMPTGSCPEDAQLPVRAKPARERSKTMQPVPPSRPSEVGKAKSPHADTNIHSPTADSDDEDSLDEDTRKVRIGAAPYHWQGALSPFSGMKVASPWSVAPSVVSTPSTHRSSTPPSQFGYETKQNHRLGVDLPPAGVCAAGQARPPMFTPSSQAALIHRHAHGHGQELNQPPLLSPPSGGGRLQSIPSVNGNAGRLGPSPSMVIARHRAKSLHNYLQQPSHPPHLQQPHGRHHSVTPTTSRGLPPRPTSFATNRPTLNANALQTPAATPGRRSSTTSTPTNDNLNTDVNPSPPHLVTPRSSSPVHVTPETDLETMLQPKEAEEQHIQNGGSSSLIMEQDRPHSPSPPPPQAPAPAPLSDEPSSPSSTPQPPTSTPPTDLASPTTHMEANNSPAEQTPEKSDENNTATANTAFVPPPALISSAVMRFQTAVDSLEDCFPPKPTRPTGIEGGSPALPSGESGLPPGWLDPSWIADGLSSTNQMSDKQVLELVELCWLMNICKVDVLQQWHIVCGLRVHTVPDFFHTLTQTPQSESATSSPLVTLWGTDKAQKTAEVAQMVLAQREKKKQTASSTPATPALPPKLFSG